MPFRNGLRSGSLTSNSSSAVSGGQRAACRVKTSAPLAGYVAAGLGVGKTLTSPTTALLHNTIDTIAIVLNDRVLVTQQGGDDNTPHIDNGIYTVTQLANGVGLPLVLTRATDTDEDAEVTASINVFVSEGSPGSADTGWTLLTNNPIVVDTTPLQFTQYSASTTLGFTYTEFLLDNEPTAETGATDCTYTPTYGGGLVTSERWDRAGGTKIKTVDYTYAGSKVSTEVRKVFASDGTTIIAQVTWSYAYTGQDLASSTMVRDV